MTRLESRLLEPRIQVLGRLDADGPLRGSPGRLWPFTDPSEAVLVRRQPSKGLRLPARLALAGFGSLVIFLDRVDRLVSGGEAGAYLGALGVSIFSSLAAMGVSALALTSSALPAMGCSISVSASSSVWARSFSLWLLALGKRRRGFTSSRELASSPSENFLKIFFPRLQYG